MPSSLYVLATAAFAIGTSEFIIMGLLPDISTNLHVDLPAAGLLVTAYALGVVIGAPVLSLVTARLPQRPTLLALFTVFSAGNLGCALSPGYTGLMLARVVTAWSHGAFLGIVGAVAMQLVTPQQQARANALIFGGITLANVLGVPAGVALGHRFGWRATFWAVAGLASLVSAALIWLLPPLTPGKPTLLRHELGVLRSRRVLMSLSLSIVNSASLLCLLTYVTPYLTDVLKIRHSSTAPILFLFGVALTAGTQLAGRSGDRSLPGTVAYGLASASLMLLALNYVAPHPHASIALLLFWGMASFGICPVMHTLVIRDAADSPVLASTLNHSAFNLGNACGSWLGSIALAGNVGLNHLPLISAALAAMGLILLVLSKRLHLSDLAALTKSFAGNLP